MPWRLVPVRGAVMDENDYLLIFTVLGAALIAAIWSAAALMGQ